MITETTKLVTTFMTSENKQQHWSKKDVDTSLSAEEIKDICDLMTSLDLFEKDGVKLFDSVVSAKFVHIREIPIFDNTLEEELPTENPASASYPLVNYVETVGNSGDLPTNPIETTSVADLSTKERQNHTKAITMSEELPTFMVASSQLPARLPQATRKTNLSKSEESHLASNKMDSHSMLDNQVQGDKKKGQRLKRIFTRVWGNHEKYNEDSS